MATEATAPAFRLVGLRKSFPGTLGLGRREVLHGIDLALARGRNLGLVGPNGSGKSTLLRTLAGIERTSGGTLEVLGGSPDAGHVRRRIGFLPEVSPFPGELSARAALDLLGSLQGMPRAERKRRVPAFLERVGLRESARRALGRFSKGMLRRFGLAQAFLHDPDLLLLDEPTAGLDAVGVGVLADLLGEARARGASVVISSHLFSDVLEHADELAVLVDGRVAASGEPQAVVAGDGRVRLELEDVDEATLDQLERAVQAAGGRVVFRGPGAGALLELYRRLEGGAR
ncbi:MAG: ABC transporter ATP-binding protein [Planctomycetota bacterium]|nr:ABC transporter ATP-binding protein [Planctomycetota bacterium]